MGRTSNACLWSWDLGQCSVGIINSSLVGGLVVDAVPACCKGRVYSGRVRLNGLEGKGTCGMEVDAEAVQNT